LRREKAQSLREKIKQICLKGMHVFAWAMPVRHSIARRRIAQVKLSAHVCVGLRLKKHA